ncbi:hypothetical protein ABZY31_16560 [Streptomyces sp. NPDC006529]|uniref:hypothetical protein n=1 Tax=Streptomyces sp. NPDC006529 TaxID=3157177 RepID=UPI0033BC9618
MSAHGVSPATQWPPTPAWMSDCAECVRLYGAVQRVHAAADGARDGAGTGAAAGVSRTRLARHLANMHLEHIPRWTPGCAPCSDHRAALERATASGLLGAGASWLAAEHRAAHLFVPGLGTGPS